jgi:hypothetical protein
MRSLILYQRLVCDTSQAPLREQLVLPGTCLGIWLLRGQPCTATVSPCLINGNAPDLAKTRFVEDLHKELTSKYV